MGNFFRKLFHLFPGEGRDSLLFALLGFLWAFAAAAGLKFADALFLLHIGAEKLPIAYSISATLMIFSAAFLIWAFHKFPTYRVFSVVLLFSSLFYFCIFLFFKFGIEHKESWFLLKIFGTIQFSVMVTSFWTFIDDYFHLQDAKRLFSLFNSMIFLGIALTGLIMLLGLVEFEMLSLLISASFLGAIFLIEIIRRGVDPVHDDRTLHGEQFGEESTFTQLMRAILQSRFTCFLMCGNFLTYVLMILTEYNVLSSFDRHFAANTQVMLGDEAEAALTLFMGKALATISASNLLFGLFIYSRLLRRFGIARLLLITPLLLLSTYLGWITEDALLFALMGYFVVEGTFYVVDDANFNILLNGVPTNVKHKVRILIEAFMEPFGTLTSALLISYAPLSPKGLALLITLIFLGVQILIGKNYLRALYLNIKENRIDFKKTILEWTRGLSKKEKKGHQLRLLTWLRWSTLNEPLPGEYSPKEFAADLLIRMQAQDAIDKILQASNSFDPKEKAQLLALFEGSSFEENPKVIEKCEEWLQDIPEGDLKQDLLWFLAKRGAIHPDKLMDDLDAEDIRKKGPAIAALLTAPGTIPREEVFRNKKIAYEKIEGLLSQKSPQAIRFGLDLLALSASASDIDIVIPFLFHASSAVSREAAYALKKMVDEKAQPYGPRLLEAFSQLGDLETRLALLDAMSPVLDATLIEEALLLSETLKPQEARRLQEIVERQGLKNIPLLLSILKNANYDDQPRLIAARIVAGLALPQLKKHLVEVLGPQIERAAFAFYYRYKRFEEAKEIDLQLLRDGLGADFYSATDFVIELLSLAGELEEGELLSQAMRSPNLKVQSQVLEALEKCAEPRIFQMLFPLVDASPLEVKLQHIRRMVDNPELSLTELLQELENSAVLSNEILAYYYMQKLNIPKWRQKLKKKMVHENESFKTFAYEILE